MKNFKKVMAVMTCAAMVTTLTACGGSSAKYTQVGFGMVTSVKEGTDSNQVNTTMATVALDKDGKIAYVDLDVAQQNTNDSKELRTKEEKELDYNMKGSSGIGKEWYEQVEFLEGELIGMTADDVANIETYEKNAEHTTVPAEGTDIASGCTIDIGAFQAALAEAFETAK